MFSDPGFPTFWPLQLFEAQASHSSPPGQYLIHCDFRCLWTRHVAETSRPGGNLVVSAQGGLLPCGAEDVVLPDNGQGKPDIRTSVKFSGLEMLAINSHLRMYRVAQRCLQEVILLPLVPWVDHPAEGLGQGWLSSPFQYSPHTLGPVPIQECQETWRNLNSDNTKSPGAHPPVDGVCSRCLRWRRRLARGHCTCVTPRRGSFSYTGQS